MQSLGSELKRDETTLVLVSGKRAIMKEWRFFVYKNQIITGSLYLVGEERVDETISCAGEYACDLSAIVEFGAKAAWEDYEAVNQF